MLCQRIILTAKNDKFRYINQIITDLLPGDYYEYKSIDSNFDSDEGENISIETLNGIEHPSLPPHILKLKIGEIIMLIRNVNTKMGMCNGTRLYVKEVHQNYIVAQKLMTIDYYLIPRMSLTLDNA